MWLVRVVFETLMVDSNSIQISSIFLSMRAGLLNDIPDPDAFLLELVQSLPVVPEPIVTA